MQRATINYTSKDYESIKREVLTRIPQLTDKWTDFNHSDMGVVLLELFCGIGDMLAYYIDSMANEAFIATARQRQSMVNLCRLISYRLHNPVASTVEVTLSIAQPLGSAFSIPSGTVVFAEIDREKVYFETTSEAVFAPGRVNSKVSAVQGIRRSETFIPKGEAFASHTIDAPNMAEGSIKVGINDFNWRLVHHFQDSMPDSMDFRISTDALGKTTIEFGDNIRGMIPPASNEISVAWLETLGAAGNISAGLINSVEVDFFHDEKPVRVAVTNDMPSTGGADREDMDTARQQAPATVRTLYRALTAEDYATLTQGFPGVAKAKVIDLYDCNNLRYFSVRVAIAPEGGGLPSQKLKDDVLAFLMERKIPGVEVVVYDSLYVEVDINATIWLEKGADELNIREKLDFEVDSIFNFDKQDFGGTIYYSDIVDRLNTIAGVSHINLKLPAKDIIAQRGEIITLANKHLDLREVVN